MRYYLILLFAVLTSCAAPKLLDDVKGEDLAYGQVINDKCTMLTPDYLIQNGYVDQSDERFYLAQRNWRWEVDDTITIRLVNTPRGTWTTFRRLKVEAMLEEYRTAMNDRINFVINPPGNGVTDHRWGAEPGSNYMILGSVVRVLNDKTRLTGNFGTDQSITIRHEIGHLVNLGHSHQATRLPWNAPVVYRDMFSRGWSKQQTDLQILNEASSAQYEKVSYSTLDYMGYRYGGTWRTDGVAARPVDRFLQNHLDYFTKYYPAVETNPEPVTPVGETDVDLRLCKTELNKIKVDLGKKTAVINRVIRSYLVDPTKDFINTFTVEFGLE